jgi:hypothetical protein
MAELVRTNDPALLSAIEGLLTAGQIPHHVADRHEAEARALLIDAGLGEWLHY